MSTLNTAVQAAKEAGKLIRQKAAVAKQVQYKSSAQDLVTEVDQASEAMIRKQLLSQYPEHVILGEEGVEPGAKASKEALEEHRGCEHLWIVDPIDGTTNFVHGFPMFCVSIAYAYNQEVVAGVIYDPLRDELFTAEKGKGAFLNGKEIRISNEKTLEESLLATGFPAGDKEARQRNLEGILKLSPLCRNIRAGGSAALHLAYVAAGRLTGFWELDLNAWDLAAGSLLVLEAGGDVTDTAGHGYDLVVRHISASNGHIHPFLLNALKEAQATGF